MNTKRIQHINTRSYSSGNIIVYWMSRDQRVEDNWALVYAQEMAAKHHVSCAVVFCLRASFPYATERIIDFMLKGLEEVEEKLSLLHIPFYFLLGDPEEEIPAFIENHAIGFLIQDFSPLRIYRQWTSSIAKNITIPYHEVDTHNIVPVWVASHKQAYGAYTLRPKIHRLLPEFLDEFPALQHQTNILDKSHDKINWNQIRNKIQYDAHIKPVDWIKPGETEAKKILLYFVENKLKNYAMERNDPTKDAQSNLSPYLHFGHISSQRIALEVGKVKRTTAAKDAFLEELIVRKELSDNFCFYNQDYDNPKGFPDWARGTLKKHTHDHRAYVYTLQELEEAKTHDDLWNAAQKEMILKGKMHGYLRMYWAKKILEWSPDVEIAQEYAKHLNNTYFLDGRDPNGYTGIAWSMGGVHDRPWFERPLFGKIRYMSYNGAKSKFDVTAYMQQTSIE